MSGMGISSPSIFALSTSIAALLLSQPLLAYSTQNPQYQLINLLIRLLLFVLVPITFLSGTGLLILRMAVPSESPCGQIYDAQIEQMAKTTVAMALASLLAGVAIGVYIVSPDAVGAWWFGR